jgi:hypothetical protein
MAPNQLAGRELGQPAPLLLLGAVMQDVGRDDAGMQLPAERIEARETELAIDHGFVRKSAAGAAVLLRHRGAEETRRARLRPHRAVVHALLVPALEVRPELGRNEAARLLLEEDEVFAHPDGAREVEGIHGLTAAEIGGANTNGRIGTADQCVVGQAGSGRRPAFDFRDN